MLPKSDVLIEVGCYQIFKLIMAFEFNNLSFDHENSFQFSYDQTRQFDCGSQYAASAHRHIPEKRHFPDMPPTQNDNCLSNEEYSRTENSKRSFDDDENSQAAAKRKREAKYIENSDDMSHVDPLSHISVFPGYYEDCHHSVRSSQAEETDSYIFDCLPRKLVSIGPNHQTEIPELQSNIENTDGDITSDKWLGNYVGPMLNLSYSDVRDCRCLDKGSIMCVRQHVMEAREQLKNVLGYERFVELGLSEMGEQVVLNWTEEEEKVFNEVVMSNPTSAGRNFWEVLPSVFPSRSKKELVSYYFNVFMLRKRAEQNRSSSLDIDSDNDEWQDGETEENESGLELPEDNEAKKDSVGLDIHQGTESDNDNDNAGKSSAFDYSSHVHEDSCTSYDHEYNDHGDSKPLEINHSPTLNDVTEEVIGNGSVGEE